jgi:hypothetical protein
MKTLLAGIALALTATSASALQLDSLKGLMGSGGSLTSGSASNAAGILQYCMSNNYLGGDSGAAGVKDQLLGSLGGGDQNAASNDASGSSTGALLGKLGAKSGNAAPTAAAPTQDKGYLDGAKGLLKSGDGKTLDLSGGGSEVAGTSDLKAQLTRKACDAVLKQGKSMIGMGK